MRSTELTRRSSLLGLPLALPLAAASLLTPPAAPPAIAKVAAPLREEPAPLTIRIVVDATPVNRAIDQARLSLESLAREFKQRLDDEAQRVEWIGG